MPGAADPAAGAGDGPGEDQAGAGRGLGGQGQPQRGQQDGRGRQGDNQLLVHQGCLDIRVVNTKFHNTMTHTYMIHDEFIPY